MVRGRLKAFAMIWPALKFKFDTGGRVWPSGYIVAKPPAFGKITVALPVMASALFGIVTPPQFVTKADLTNSLPALSGWLKYSHGTKPVMGARVSYKRIGLGNG